MRRKPERRQAGEPQTGIKAPTAIGLSRLVRFRATVIHWQGSLIAAAEGWCNGLGNGRCG